MLKNTFTLLVIFCASLYAQNGIVRSYYSKGKIESKISFANDVLEGTSYWYFPNGNIKEEKTYSHGKLNGWVRSYFETGLLKEEIAVKDGIRDGIMRTFYDNGGLKEVRHYEQGVLVKKVSVDLDATYVPALEEYYAGNRQSKKKKGEVEFICDADICPQPNGGMNAIYEKLVLPEQLLPDTSDGTVVLLVTVDVRGNVEDTKIIQSISDQFDKCAKDAIAATRFLPGQKDGQLIKSNVTVRIEFLEEKENEIAVNNQSVIADTISDKQEIISVTNKDSNIPKPPTEDSEQYKIQEQKIAELKKEETQLKEVYPPVKKDLLNESDIQKPDENKVDQLVVDEKPQNLIKEIICNTDVCPQPVDGLTGLLNRFHVPKRVIKKGLEGEVVIKASIDETGKVTQTEVLNDIGFGAGIAAEVAVLETQFVAGKRNGQPVNSEAIITLPVRKNN
ncbi:MAG: TonB family protein [bacterium]